jgi:hypothetical protein
MANATKCTDCNGTGWTCANCGKPGDQCKCDPVSEQDAHDCQTCEGSGEAEEN